MNAEVGGECAREPRQFATTRWSVIVERINAGLAAARERGAKLGRPRTLDRHLSSVAKLNKRGMSGRKIAAKLNIPAGSVFAVLKKVKRNSQ